MKEGFQIGHSNLYYVIKQEHGEMYDPSMDLLNTVLILIDIPRFVPGLLQHKTGT